MKMRIAVRFSAAIGAAAFALVPVVRAQQDDAALVAKARGIHERVITLDTHNDISPTNFTPRLQLHDAT